MVSGSDPSRSPSRPNKGRANWETSPGSNAPDRAGSWAYILTIRSPGPHRGVNGRRGLDCEPVQIGIRDRRSPGRRRSQGARKGCRGSVEEPDRRGWAEGGFFIRAEQFMAGIFAGE